MIVDIPESEGNKYIDAAGTYNIRITSVEHDQEKNVFTIKCITIDTGKEVFIRIPWEDKFKWVMGNIGAACGQSKTRFDTNSLLSKVFTADFIAKESNGKIYFSLDAKSCKAFLGNTQNKTNSAKSSPAEAPDDEDLPF